MAAILTYGADLIVAAYTLAVVAALVLVVRTRMPWYRGLILCVGLAILGYVVKETFVALPSGPYRWDFGAAALSLVIGVTLPFLSPRLRAGIRNSPLLHTGTRVLLMRSNAGMTPDDGETG